MRDTDYVYAVAKIRVKEMQLLTTPQLEAAIAAPDYPSAVKLLTDAGFADFSEKTEEQILREKEEQAFEFICEIAPDKTLFDFLIVKNDFHNIKAVLKSIVANSDYSEFTLKPHLIDPALIFSAATEKNYENLPAWAVDPIKAGYDLVTSTMDGQLLDVFLDKRYLETSLKMAKETKEDFSIGLAERTLFVANLQIALRGAEMGKSKEFLIDSTAKGGIMDAETLISLVLEGRQTLAEKLSENGMQKIADGVLKSNLATEKALDNYLLDYVKGAKYQSFGISPLIGYYLARINEVKTVRILLCCKRTGLTEAETKERVRNLYV